MTTFYNIVTLTRLLSAYEEADDTTHHTLPHF